MPRGSLRSENAPGIALCRECHAEVPGDAFTCDGCGAPRPARPVFTGEGYEWKTSGTWMGEPLVHVAFGLDATGRPRTARGLVAIGQRAMGGVAVGIVACGFVSVGVVAIG